MTCSAALVSAMDWDTAREVATCHNRPGYQGLASRVVHLLGEHQIHSMVMYFAQLYRSEMPSLPISVSNSSL